jgi:hypothetical protein
MTQETPMRKDDWKAFFRWIETASDRQLERAHLRLTIAYETFREEGPRRDAQALLRQVAIEREARVAVRSRP